MASIVLLSGGFDSAVSYFNALHEAKKGMRQGPIHTLTFDYGQSNNSEVWAAKTVRDLALTYYQGQVGNGQLVPLGKQLFPRIGSLLDPDEPIRTYGEGESKEGLDSSFIPHRNLLFMTLAAMWARHFKADSIITGLRGGFPDCSEEFERLVQRVLNQSDPSWLLTAESAVHMSRADTIKLAQVTPGCMEAISHSLTCFEGTERPCGKCLPCTKRAEGFMEVGIEDPLITRLNARD